MFSRLLNAFSSPSYPSVVLVVGRFSTPEDRHASIAVLHPILEDGTFEQYGNSVRDMPTFCHGATEELREQLGEVKICAGDGESRSDFLDDVEERARKLSPKFPPSNFEHGQAEYVEAVQQITDILREAALDAIIEQPERGPSLNATDTWPVYLIRIKRSRPGPIITGEPSSWPSLW